MVVCNIIAKVSGVPKGQPYNRWQYKIVEFFSKIVGFTALWSVGCQTGPKNRKVNVDYSKWLGPGWKEGTEPPSTIITGHSSFLDIFMHMTR